MAERELTTRNSGRLYTLDALKFFASVLIVFHHYQQYTGLHFVRFNFYHGQFYFGYMVELFFILSGFFTAIHIERDQQTSFVDFMKHKVIRIWPMAALSIVCAVAVSMPYKLLTSYWFFEGRVSVWNFVTNVLLINVGGAFTTNQLGINNPTWYLCVLLVCYAAYKGILYLCSVGGGYTANAVFVCPDDGHWHWDPGNKMDGTFFDCSQWARVHVFFLGPAAVFDL